jgi:hypothetical protein
MFLAGRCPPLANRVLCLSTPKHNGNYGTGYSYVCFIRWTTLKTWQRRPVENVTYDNKMKNKNTTLSKQFQTRGKRQNG